jgi:hypothetical protein
MSESTSVPQNDGPSAAAPPSIWFKVNLIGLLVLIPLATILFQRHFRLYFTGIVLVGGLFTAWALVRLLWSVFEKATDFNGWDYSRRKLSFSGTTRLLVVAALALAFLWPTTASLYFENSGGKASAYKMEVLRSDTGQPYVDPFSISASTPVAGRPRLLQFGAVKLTCRIVEPAGYDSTDCSIAPGRSTRLEVPGGFPEKEFHLLRLVPAASFYRQLPRGDQTERSNFDLEVSVARKGKASASKALRWPDYRRQTLNVLPMDQGEQSAVRRLEEDPERYRQYLLTTFLAKGIQEDAAKKTAAVLAVSRKEWPVAYVRAGDRISISIVRLSVPGEDPPQVEARSIVTHVVTAESVQTVWLAIN